MSTIWTSWTSDGMKNKHNVQRGKDYMKKLCKILRQAMKMIYFENKK